MKALIFILAVLLYGCASSKKSSSNVYETGKEETYTYMNDSSSTVKVMDISINEVSSGTLTVDREETKYSVPDSTGRQHVTSSIRTKAVYEGKTGKVSESSGKESSVSTTNIRDSTSYKTVYSSEEKSEKKSPVVLRIIAIIAGIVVSGFIVYYFLIGKKK